MYRVVLFGYNFIHNKSENFIHILKKNDIEIVAYIAADAIKLNFPEKIYKENITKYTIFHPKDLCKKYNIPFFATNHNSDRTIQIIKDTSANLGIVSGARILKKNIINSLEYGIINFHPGKIPEASGLDALLWSIYKNIKPFVTTHFIDEKIDAGNTIFIEEVEVLINDSIKDIQHNISITEYKELEKLCSKYLAENKNIKSEMISNYTKANAPMNLEQQDIAIKKFEQWKTNIL